MYKRKTTDEWQLHSNYGYGWECECIAESYSDARQMIKEYRENSNGQHKLIKKRVKQCD